MRKRLIPIYSVLVVAIVLLAVFVPSCDGGGATGTIIVQATLCGDPWQGAVNYTLTPGSGSPTSCSALPASFNATCCDWTCDYIAGGPPGAYLENITPSATQTVSENSTTTFTLNFELEQDASIEFLTWTINGLNVTPNTPETPYEVIWSDIIDVHYAQHVAGCQGYDVAVNETSRLWIHYMGWTDMPLGEPLCGLVPDPSLYVVNDLCAVNKTAGPQAEPAEKVSQMTTYWGEPIPPSQTPLPLICCENTELDVETIWMLEKEIDYTKSINWFGISIDPGMYECVLFDLVVPPIPGWYVFQLVAEAEVVLMDDEDVDVGNNKDMSPPLYLEVWSGD